MGSLRLLVDTWLPSSSAFFRAFGAKCGHAPRVLSIGRARALGGNRGPALERHAFVARPLGDVSSPCPIVSPMLCRIRKVSRL